MAPVTAAAGFPSRAEAVERYAARTGFDVTGVAWYEAFAYFKLAVICQGIAPRAAGGAMLGSGFDEAQRLLAPLVGASSAVLAGQPGGVAVGVRAELRAEPGACTGDDHDVPGELVVRSLKSIQ